MAASVEHFLRKYRGLLFFGMDVAIGILAVLLAFLLRFDGKIPVQYLESGGVIAGMALVLGAIVPVFLLMRVYAFSWRHVGITDMLVLVKALVVSSVFTLIGFLLFRDLGVFEGFPRSVLFISYLILFLGAAGLRLAQRAWNEVAYQRNNNDLGHYLIVGAGDAGALLARDILNTNPRPFQPVGFVDDDPRKQGKTIYGMQVLGSIDAIPELVALHNVTGLIIALPSTGPEPIRRAVEKGREAGVKTIRVVPPLQDLLRKELSLQLLREVQVEDLLGRAPFSLDPGLLEGFLSEKRILVTGAAGSIGAELCKQIAGFEPKLLLLLDQDETGVFYLKKELEDLYPAISLVPLVADIADEQRISQVFAHFRPQIVFHAAAYKHVPLMEEQPEEAVKNNVFGTYTAASAALRNQAEAFVFVSTDKAINPTSVMGATKRVGEMICQSLSQRGLTKFASVRFGNVLDSRGSVIPLFREQIKKGGPVEVTHPDMQRYFMLNSEACLLVLQAGAMGKGGEVFVLDMGKPMKIADLAHEMIRLSGYEPDKDISIVFTGIRPGEKLFEEILQAEEGVIETVHRKIFITRLGQVEEQKIQQALQELRTQVQQGNKEAVKQILRTLVPVYQAKSQATELV